MHEYALARTVSQTSRMFLKNYKVSDFEMQVYWHEISQAKYMNVTIMEDREFELQETFTRLQK